MIRRLSAAAAALAFIGAGATAASADPYAVTYSGTLSGSSIPSISDGETYDVTFVFDNGSSTAGSQTWTDADLTCVVWRFNDARDVIFAQDLTVAAPNVIDSAQTDASGALTDMYSFISSAFPLTGTAQSSASGLLPPYAWFATGSGPIFYDSGAARDVQDASGGVQMAAANWSDPTPFPGDCLDQVNMAPPPPAVVPTLTEWAMILLGGLLALTAATIVSQRRRS